LIHIEYIVFVLSIEIYDGGVNTQFISVNTDTPYGRQYIVHVCTVIKCYSYTGCILHVVDNI